MSIRPTKPRISRNKPLFHLQDKKADENELSIGLIKSAKRTGQLSLCNRGLGTGKIIKHYLNFLTILKVVSLLFPHFVSTCYCVCRYLSVNKYFCTLSEITYICFSVPEKLWKIDELVLDETKEVDFTRSDQNNWWNSEPLKTLDLSSNVIKTISPNVRLVQQLVTLKVSHNFFKPVNYSVIWNHLNGSLIYISLVSGQSALKIFAQHKTTK